MRTYQNKEELKAEIVLLTRSAGQRLFLNGKRTRKMDFRYILRRIHSNGISWAGYTSGLQIPMRIYHSKSCKTD